MMRVTVRDLLSILWHESIPFRAVVCVAVASLVGMAASLFDAR